MKRISDKQKIKLIEKAVTTKRLHALFREIWDERENEYGECYCYETNKSLPSEYYRSCTSCYHHILPKNMYPELAFLKENIVILHPDVHHQIEGDLDKCPKVKELTIKLREKWTNQ